MSISIQFQLFLIRWQIALGTWVDALGFSEPAIILVGKVTRASTRHGAAVWNRNDDPLISPQNILSEPAILSYKKNPRKITSSILVR